jgi:signal transduction histidine kinase
MTSRTRRRCRRRASASWTKSSPRSRLALARERADQLARQLATGERLAAIGRVAAGLAHEIRNPIGAMRLKAENAIAGDANRKDQALSAILGQIERLDALLRPLLSVTTPDKSRVSPFSLSPFSKPVSHAERSRARSALPTKRARL